MRDNVEAECPEDYFKEVNNCTFSRLCAKWNENKVYQPTRQNRFGTTVGSIYYWKYCSMFSTWYNGSWKMSFLSPFHLIRWTEPTIV
jgi:hypothetical protein